MHGKVHMSTLAKPDRSAVVLQLQQKGHTIESIAEKLSCSERLINRILSSDMTTVVASVLGNAPSDTETRAARIEAAQAKKLAAQYKRQRDRLIEDRKTHACSGH